MANINDPNTNVAQKVDTVPQAARIIVYDASGNAIGSYTTDPAVSDRALPVRNIPGNSQQIGAGIGTGGYIGQPQYNTNKVLLGDKSHLVLDNQGSLSTRGQVTTDEGSWRDDFSGTSLFTDLVGTATVTSNSKTVIGSGTNFISSVNSNQHIRLSSHPNSALTKIERVVSDTEIILDEGYVGTSGTGTLVKSEWHIQDSVSTGTITVANSCVTLTSSTTANDRVNINKDGDFAPIKQITYLSVSQRIIDQEVHIGFTDSINGLTVAENEVEIVFDGILDTVLKFITKSFSNVIDKAETIITMPFGLTTASLCKYHLDYDGSSVSLFIEDQLVAKHDKHIPNQYTKLNYYAEIKNGAVAPLSATSLVIDVADLSNVDRLEVAMSFKGDAMPTQVVEDTHHVLTPLASTTMAANQIIAQVTVPVGKTFFMTGYTIDSNSTVVTGIIRIGKDAMTGNAQGVFAPDTDLWEEWSITAGALVKEQFPNPKYKARGLLGGTVVKITVTPSANTTTLWKATINYVLR